MEQQQQISLDQIIPRLSERGQIELEMAGLRVANDMLSGQVDQLLAEVQRQREEIQELTGAPDPG